MMLAGFVPMLAATLAPESVKYALVGLGALAAVVGIAMLIRQGPFQPHPRPTAHRDATGEATRAGPTARGRNHDAEGAASPDAVRGPAELVR